MSKKSFFKGLGKKVALPDAKPVPRILEDINKSYSEELAKAGQAQYLLYVYQNELEQANRRLLSLNQEAAARNELDKATTAKGAVNEQTT